MKLQDLAIDFDYTCYWCKERFPLQMLSRDHLVRLRTLKRLGLVETKKKSSSGNRPTGGRHNIVLACKVCNFERG